MKYIKKDPVGKILIIISGCGTQRISKPKQKC